MEITIPKIKPRDYQLPLWQAGDRGYKRFILRWARRSGKDLTCVHFACKKALERVGNYYHILPFYTQSRKAIWDGKDREGKNILDAFPPEIIKKKNDQEMKLELVNGSIWQLIGADNIDTVLSTNPVGLTFSEYSLMRPNVWSVMRPILAENGGWAIFQFTPRGRNHAFDLEQAALADPARWFVSVVTADKYLDQATLDTERKEIIAATGDDAHFQQEFMVSYNAAQAGAYYAKQMEVAEKEGRISGVPHDASLPVHTVWDLGISDSTAVGFYQSVGLERRLIEAVEFTGLGLPDIIADLQHRPYVYGKHFAPHDIEARELGTGKSRREVAEALGWKFEVVPNLPVKDGIDAARTFLGTVWFDKVKAAIAVRYLPLYQRAYDDRIHAFRDQPQHDYTSHIADMIRYSAVVSDKMTNDADKDMARERARIKEYLES